ncbi:ribonuclease R [Pantoea sp. Mhis]|uniref:ribonuclease R n=1 Tax=Pantoea sp. Mhis TaxID=2576759 RepID=UPI00135BBC0A|nr:ribonuclease R [Pantoea sp. Mhis]MXP56382.1 ribonuclease R [Pantoea sp. Mhis]
MSKDHFQQREKERYKDLIPSRKYILTLLKKHATPINRYEIAQKINITTKKQQEALRRRLRAMDRDGQLVFTHHHCYTLPGPLKLLRGKVIGHRDGYGFLRVEGEKDDLYLSSEQMRLCLHGDIVLAKPSSINRKGRREARIIRILQPRNNRIVGKYFINNQINFVVPSDTRLNFDILIPQQETYIKDMGLIVVVEIIQRATRHTKAIGKIIEVLGKNMSTSLAIDMAIRTHEIPYIWPKIIEKEINKLNLEISENVKKNRIDLRHLPLITIDGEDSCDFDDAVYCEKKNNGGWRLWVAIADVSYYVQPGSALDNEAYQRGTSIYFPSRVVPMLPEILSNGLCSLQLKVDRLCIVCEMNVSENGNLISYKHYEAVMHSYGRLTYNNVWDILQGNLELCKKYAFLVKHLKELYCLYKKLKTARENRGGISLETQEAKFIFNSELRIKCIEPIVRNDAHKLIEECMILANIASARFIEKNKEPSLFRDHDRPSDDNINDFRIVLKELGLKLSGGKKPQSIDYSDLLKQISNRPDAEMLQTMLIRSMKQAVYDPENRGHFGLALSSYAHFTSPIRRYSDLLLHRTIKYLLSRKKISVKLKDNLIPFKGGCHYTMKQMLQFGQHCSMTERRADEAVRDVIDWMKCDFMQNQVGNVFSGIISSVTNFGFFVRINHLFIDGLVHISTLDNDSYHFDSITQRLIAEYSGFSYRLGEEVEVQVVAVNIEERKIDFSLLSSKVVRNK